MRRSTRARPISREPLASGESAAQTFEVVEETIPGLTASLSDCRLLLWQRKRQQPLGRRLERGRSQKERAVIQRLGCVWSCVELRWAESEHFNNISSFQDKTKMS